MKIQIPNYECIVYYRNGQIGWYKVYYSSGLIRTYHKKTSKIEKGINNETRVFQDFRRESTYSNFGYARVMPRKFINPMKNSICLKALSDAYQWSQTK